MSTKHVPELYEACVNEQVDTLRGLNAEFATLQAEVQAGLDALDRRIKVVICLSLVCGIGLLIWHAHLAAITCS